MSDWTRRKVVMAAVAATWSVGGPARAGGPWVGGHRSRARLVVGDDDRTVGVQIALDPGFKTYWRHPGETGLPPAFDWSGSRNLDGTEVMWPAPARLEDPGGVSYGYQDGVVLPVRLRPAKAGEPVSVVLKLDYGVCKDICIPAQALLRLDLPATGSPDESRLVRDALARVPTERPLAAAGAPSILAVEPSAGQLAVAVRVPAGETPSLFVEAPEPWLLVAGAGRTTDGTARFAVEVLDRPREATGLLPLRVTLVAGAQAIESSASIDSALLPR